MTKPLPRRVLKKGTVVEVEWADIQDASEDDWNDPDAKARTANVYTLGYVQDDFTEGNEVIVVARDYSPEEDRYSGQRAEPVGVVLGIRVLDNSRTLEFWEPSKLRWGVKIMGQELEQEEDV